MSAIAIANGQSRPGRGVEHLEQGLSDLAEDFDELLHRCGRSDDALAAAGDDFRSASLYPATRTLLVDRIAMARDRCRIIADRLLRLRESASSARTAPGEVDRLRAARAELADLLRAEHGLNAALLVAADWQSPSFGHSILPAAGRQGGRIEMHVNDYKRDRHLDAQGFEESWVERMVDGAQRPRALLTSCGMAAFTTILTFLSRECMLERPVLAGSGLYHESRLLLEGRLPGRVHVVDELDGEALARAIGELRPGVVFLDTLANTKLMPAPELLPVMEAVAGTGTCLVLDNTCLSISCQPFALAGPSVRLIVFESLLKYAQLGLDRANAGLILAFGEDAEGLSSCREHAGTNIADVAVHGLLRPSRPVLRRRLARIGRNALILARRLDDRLGARLDVRHPGLSSPELVPSGAEPFLGGCLSIGFPHWSPGRGRDAELLPATISAATAGGVPLHLGSSFGFDTTRIYLIGADGRDGEAFVRVAAGTEDRASIELVADVLEAGIGAVVGADAGIAC